MHRKRQREREFVAAMHSVRLIGAKYDFATNTYESEY